VKPATPLERVAIAVASLVLTITMIALLSGFFAGRDQPGVSGASAGPGQAFADLGHVHLTPGAARPAYDSDPPTSGAHVPVPVTRDETQLSDDQLLQALEQGDVVLVYGGRVPPAGLVQLALSVASPFTPALAAVGQAVILARRPGTSGITALAWARMLRVEKATDPALAAFAQYWLGRGAP
jgi:hypothetical protein